ncbi:hypothetical protein ASPZODRAFT_142629 [Penicilliopsis zonata CBS 506.65]|uniref:F-box domain-containing protein n=1 Tax=Penicilliopsis zonata CBS 506.65 TaxID=1073090 RepID=A0A1L9SFP6_9EURO|nr:hypothetical protein ASPZODRAFT_142629 [Penicilliopsis zonata CBS 506.65]OJJ45992.1 hypothetical protein ASPZODRAFT_142629 [Penicilliopsis zonata CBS 506.65]
MLSLPLDIQYCIIPFADPITLIALSQTNAHLRRLISPTRVHFVERLLSLEYASVSCEWEARRWACTSCLRLLPHWHFNNHSLFQQRYQPRETTTSWGRQGKKSQPHSENTDQRHIRRCNECRFQRGEFHGFTRGTIAVPIVIGHQEAFGTVVDRYFPRFSNTRPAYNAPVFAVYRDGATDRLWTLYRVRCPGCCRWKELRAFRVGGSYPRWEPIAMTPPDRHDEYWNWDEAAITPALLNAMRCNHCFLARHGRPALACKLETWLCYLIDQELHEQGANLTTGWKTLLGNLRFLLDHPLKNEIRNLLSDIRPVCEKQCMRLTHEDVALLHLRRTQFLLLWEQIQENLWFRRDRWFDAWLQPGYEHTEGMQCKQDVDGEELVDYVLNT